MSEEPVDGGRVREAMIAVALGLLLAGLSTAAEPLAAGRAPLNLPPQRLSSALHALALQRRFQIVFASRDVASFRSAAAIGDYTVDEALERLLSGTGLTFRHLDDGTIAVVSAPRAAADGAASANGTNAANAPRPADAPGSGNDTRVPQPAVGGEAAAPAGSRPAETRPINSTGETSMQHRPFLARLASVLAATFAVTASGQTASGASDELAEVVVTGSRVITNGNNSPTPLTVVQAEEVLRLQPTTIADALNTMPVFSGPRTQVSNPNAALAGGAGGNAASNQLNLRNLGAQRTLVLFEGHRMAPSSTNGVVDVDMIPQLMIQRVDIVTGGVSAVYGSDAISGVVNFVTDRNFNGVKFQADAGQSSRSDGRQVSAGIAGGVGLFGGRGHIEASYQYRNDQGIQYRSSRPWLQLVTVQGNGLTAATPLYLVDNTHRANYTFGGLISGTTSSLNGQWFSTNGVLTPFVRGIATTTANVEVGGDGAYYDGSLKAPLRSHQAFLRFDFDINDRTHLYVEGAYNSKKNKVWANWQQLTNVQLSSTNAFLQSQYSTLLAAAGTTFRLSKFITDAPRLEPSIESKQNFVNVGVNGEFGAGYKWDLGFVHSDAKMFNTEIANLNNVRLAAALDAVISGGQVVCQVSTTANASQFPGCVPLNPFGPSSSTSSALAYILGDTHFNTVTKQDNVSGSITGAPFSTWAGPVNAAVSAEWRRQTYRADSDATPTDPVVCSGLIRFNCPTQQWFQAFAPRSTVDNTVSEGAIEFDLPLLKGVTLAQALNLNGAARYTRYKTSGNYTTWKVGLDWHLNDSWRLRATRSRDIRAPTLDDLYSPAAVTFGSITDQLLRETSTAPSSASGNPNLRAEIGHTTTAGIVFTPAALPGFSMTLDGFNIQITDSIYQLQGTTASTQLACYNSGGTSPACDLIVRPLGPVNTNPNNHVTIWYNSPINIASIRTYGADLEVNYATRLLGHPLSLRALATYQPHVVYTVPAITTFDMGGVAFGSGGLQAVPKVRLTGLLRYAPTEHFVIDVMERWRSRLALSNELFTTGPDTGPVAYTNLTLSYGFKLKGEGDLQTYLNVQNLFDRKPPPAAFSGSQLNMGQFGGFAIGDDPVGRYYMVGLRYHL